MSWRRPEWVPTGLIARYRAEPRFDIGEDVKGGRDEQPSGPATPTMKGPSMQQEEYTDIPLGSRVRKNYDPSWIGTVTAINAERGDFPFRVVFDDGSMESCSVLELDVLAYPVQAEADRRRGRIMRLRDELAAEREARR